MSFTRETTIWCDGKEFDGLLCSHWDSDKTTVRQHRKDLKRTGWTHVEGKDYCPNCSQRRRKK